MFLIKKYQNSSEQSFFSKISPFTSVKTFIMFSSFIRYSEIRINPKPEENMYFLIISLHFDAYFKTRFCHCGSAPLWIPTKMLLINWLFCNWGILLKKSKKTQQITSVCTRKSTCSLCTAHGSCFGWLASKSKLVLMGADIYWCFSVPLYQPEGWNNCSSSCAEVDVQLPIDKSFAFKTGAGHFLEVLHQHAGSLSVERTDY